MAAIMQSFSIVSQSVAQCASGLQQTVSLIANQKCSEISTSKKFDLAQWYHNRNAEDAPLIGNGAIQSRLTPPSLGYSSIIPGTTGVRSDSYSNVDIVAPSVQRNIIEGVVEKIPEPKLTCIQASDDRHMYKYDEKISICLERYHVHSMPVRGSHSKVPSLQEKFIRCSNRLQVHDVIELLMKRLDIPSEAELTLICHGHELTKEWSLKQVYLMYWSPKGSPMFLFYCFKPG